MDWLSNPQNVVVLLIVVATAATVYAFVTPLLESDPLKGRIKAVAVERERIRARERERLNADSKQAESRANLRAEQKEFYRKIVEALDLRKRLDDGTLSNKLAQAGKRAPHIIMTFLVLRVVLPFFFAAIVGAYVYVILPTLLAPNHKLIAVLGGLAFGFYGPNVYLSNLITKRQASIRRAWPDALDLLLICVESGMSVEAGLKKVSEEIGTQSPALAEELMLTNAELSYLQERRKAYENFYNRTGLQVVKSVVTALIQAERYGTPVGHALRVLADENRSLRMLEAEKKAASLPPKLTVPMIVFFLPCLFVVLITPAYIKIMASQQ